MLFSEIPRIWEISQILVARDSSGRRPAALKVFDRRTLFTIIAPRLFHKMSFFCLPRLVNRYFFHQMDSLGSIMDHGQNTVWLKLFADQHQLHPFFQPAKKVRCTLVRDLVERSLWLPASRYVVMCLH